MPFTNNHQSKSPSAKRPKVSTPWEKPWEKSKRDDKTKSPAYKFGKSAGLFDAIGRGVVAPALKGGANLVSKGLGAVGATRASGAAKRYAGGLDDTLRRAGMTDGDIAGKVNTARAGMASSTGRDTLSGAQNARLGGVQKGLEGMRTEGGNRLNTLGMAGTAAVGIPALMGVSRLIGNRRKKREEEEMAMGAGKQASEQLGTPIMDGFLLYCSQQGFTDEQTAQLLEKGATVAGGLGDECREFLERIAKS